MRTAKTTEEKKAVDEKCKEIYKQKRERIVQMCLECVELGYMQVYHAITGATHTHTHINNRIYYHNIIRRALLYNMRIKGNVNIVIAISTAVAADDPSVASMLLPPSSQCTLQSVTLNEC